MRKVLLVLVAALMGAISGFGQITYVQTSNTDFLYGYHDNVVVSGNNVLQASKGASLNQWLGTTNLPQTLTQHEIVSYGDYAYCIGGFNGTNTVNNVYRATVNSSGISGWSNYNALPVALRNHEVVLASNKLFVLGGITESGAINDQIYYTDLNTNGTIGTWQESNVNLPDALWGATAHFLNGYIYLVGGSNQLADSTAINNVYVAKQNPNGLLDQFVATTSLLDARNGHTMVAYGGKLFVIGGHDNYGVAMNTVYYAEPNMDGSITNWQTATSLPTVITNHASACYNGVVTVIGGQNDSTLTKKVYYVDIDDAPNFSWSLSTNELYEYTKDAEAFYGKFSSAQVIIAGGVNLSNNPIMETRYSLLNMTTDKVKKSSFVSFPFELGDERIIDSLSYNVTYNATDSFQVWYRLAGNDGDWNAWVSGGQDNPIYVNQTDRYVQYRVDFYNSSSDNISFHDLTLSIAGSQLTGNINSYDTLYAAYSPYLVTGSISITAGTLVIEPGVTLLFSPGTGFEIGAANLFCNGTATDSIVFTSYNEVAGEWNGVYFNTHSDNGVSSQMSYTVIEKAGNGSWDANLYCYSTTEPFLNNCVFRMAHGRGIYLYNSDLTIENTISISNEHGVFLRNSDPSLTNVYMTHNSGGGLYYYDQTSLPQITNCHCEYNEYGVFSPNPDQDFEPLTGQLQVNNNVSYYGVGGGGIRYAREWDYLEGGYTVTGTIHVYSASYNNYTHARLTIAPGNILRFAEGAQLIVGHYYSNYGRYYGGELYAEGTIDSTIIFTSLKDSVGHWNGIYFENASDNYSAASKFENCIVEHGNDYNLYCASTKQPAVIENCIFRESAGRGVQLYDADNLIFKNVEISDAGAEGIWSDYSSGLQFTECSIINTTNSGIYFHDSDNPTFDSLNVHNIDGIGIWFYKTQTSNFNYCQIENCDTAMYLVNSGICTLDSSLINNNGCGIWSDHYVEMYNSHISNTAYPGFPVWAQNFYAFPLLEKSTIEDNNTPIYIGGNPLYYSRYWPYFSQGYEIMANAQIYSASYNNTTHARLTIAPGNVIRFAEGVQLQIGYYYSNYGRYYGGELYAEGTSDSLITFTSLNDSIGGWNGIYFENASDNYSATSKFKNCIVEHGNDYNLYCASTKQPSVIEDCVFRESANIGVKLYDADNLIFKKVEISDAGSEGIWADYSSGLQFKECSINNSANSGIYFHDSDNPTFDSLNVNNIDGIGIWFYKTQTSNLNYCQIENCDTAMYLVNSGVCTIDSSIMQNNGCGLWSDHYVEMYNSHILSTTYPGFPVWAENFYAFPLLENSTIEDNNTPIHIGGNSLYYSRYWPYFSQGYEVVANALIRSASYNNYTHARLTIAPGNTIRFAEGVQLQIGLYSGGAYYGGELYAEGTSDSTITFTSLNDSIGGWNGIYFENASDNYSATSLLKQSVIEKGNEYNVYCVSTNQPKFNHVQIINSNGYGLRCNSASPTLQTCKVINNNSYGIYLQGNSWPTIGNSPCYTCDLYSNGGYDIYNETSNDNTNARYNYWNSQDSSFITTRIWDDFDESSRGVVYFMPVASSSIFVDPFLEIKITDEDNSTCFGNSDGAVTSLATGGATPYTYQWDGGVTSTSNSAMGLAPGSYTVTVTDQNGCFESATGNTVEPDLLSLSITHTDLSCDTCMDGTATVSAVGGTVDNAYSYLWSDPLAQTASMATGLIPGTYYVTVSDDNGCFDVATATIINPAGYSITGQVTYHNTTSTNLIYIPVHLKDTIGNTVFTQQSDAYGDFSFNGIPNNTYTLDGSLDKPWGGVNATDALLVRKQTIGLINLTGLPAMACDVSGNGSTNATDALMILQRFVHIITTFDAGDWVFDGGTITLNNVNSTGNSFQGLFYGDVNGSYLPQFNKSVFEQSVSIAKSGIKEVASEDVFELPVFTNNTAEVAAVSLAINYPTNLFQIEDVIFDGGQVVYSATEGQLRICWCSDTPIQTSQADELMSLEVRPLGPVDISNLAQYFNIAEGCEIADSWADPLDDVVLLFPELVATGIAGTDDNTTFLLGQNYPNPFNENTIIEFVLPKAGKVNLAVYNVLGEKVANLLNDSRNAGLHKVEFNKRDLAQGNYIYKIVFESGSEYYQESKMMNVR